MVIGDEGTRRSPTRFRAYAVLTLCRVIEQRPLSSSQSSRRRMSALKVTMPPFLFIL